MPRQVPAQVPTYRCHAQAGASSWVLVCICLIACLMGSFDGQLGACATAAPRSSTAASDDGVRRPTSAITPSPTAGCWTAPKP